ncbi:cell surface glycoprotein CD200 receptor 2-like [Mantella aurantiaca]
MPASHRLSRDLFRSSRLRRSDGRTAHAQDGGAHRRKQNTFPAIADLQQLAEDMQRRPLPYPVHANSWWYLQLPVHASLFQSESYVTVVMGRRGNSTDLRCGGDPGDQIMAVTWRIYHVYNSSCLFSYVAHMKGGPQIYSTCSARITLSDVTLTIQNTQISDRGKYTCEISNPYGTFISLFILQVLAQPSVSLCVNSDGSLECRAIGGFPAAVISWIPHSDDLSTTRIKDLNDTWTVISTHKFDGDSVTCFVSHPTFVNPWRQSIVFADHHLIITGGMTAAKRSCCDLYEAEKR